jgi:hypothetical protein
MAVTPSGTISMADINTALNRSSTASISMSDPGIYLLAGTATSGTISMNSTRSKTVFAGVLNAGFYSDGKGNDSYGYAGEGSSITGTLYGGTFNYFYTQGGVTSLGLNSSVIPGSNVSLTVMRARVGTGTIYNLMGFGSSMYSDFPGFLITAGDVGVNRNWQLVLN